MKGFMDENFMLESDQAIHLYHEFAKDLPIIDYHCHLSPKDITENRQFTNITEAWLEGDHYKWRAMRANGISEQYCTGGADPNSKFLKWAATVPYTIGNPLFHWTHLELLRYFDINGKILDPFSAGDIYDTTTELLQTPNYSVQGLLGKMNVEVICTTDDPVDDLMHHKEFCSQDHDLRMFPTFRPDKAYAIENPIVYNKYLEKLGDAAGLIINDFFELLNALEQRVDYFHSHGCRLADHGLEFIPFVNFEYADLARIFLMVRQGNVPSESEILQFKLGLLVHLGKVYHQYGWVQQFHLGALRNNSIRMMQSLGPDTGFDSIGDFPQAKGLSHLLSTLDASGQLTKTILYNLNPADNEVFATMAGNFNDGTAPGKVQFGSAWWFLDQKSGVEDQLEVLGNMGLLSRFVGMLTDSRSFLSFPRHEYFRRILCNMLGEQIHKGLLPNDIDWVGGIVNDISYDNARNYFQFSKSKFAKFN